MALETLVVRFCVPGICHVGASETTLTLTWRTQWQLTITVLLFSGIRLPPRVQTFCFLPPKPRQPRREVSLFCPSFAIKRRAVRLLVTCHSLAPNGFRRGCVKFAVSSKPDAPARVRSYRRFAIAPSSPTTRARCPLRASMNIALLRQTGPNNVWC